MIWQRLKNPPLREAIFDLRFQPTTILRFEEIKKFCDQFKAEFPESNEMFVFSVQADFTNTGNKKPTAPSTDRKRNGYRLSNKERSFILQLRTDGFTFSKVSPYISWDEIRTEVRPILDKFFSFFKDVKVARIALRYVNDFTLKLEKVPNEYFKILPSFPQSLPQTVSAFTIQLIIPKIEKQLHSKIVFSLEPLNNEKRFRVVFDIDIFKHEVYESKSIEKMFTDFESIRDFKNEIFFNSLTPTVLENFN